MRETQSTDEFDALVIGGGPAGATAAGLLAEAGWSVALVERKVFPRRKVCGEYLSATNWPLLQRLGLVDEFLKIAGPAVSRTAIYVGSNSVEADLPKPSSAPAPWGRALSRERLDTLLLARAAMYGVDIWQPWHCVSLIFNGTTFCGHLESQETRHSCEVRAKVVIAAHGSWELGALHTQPQQINSHPLDLLAFKAHFRQTALPLGLMPLLSFADGYGGMVHCEDGRTSLSCCIRRDRLERLHRAAGESAGEAVLQHILESCPALKPVLKDAVRDEPWISAGPIRPGLRPCYREGVFVIGNAAGEAHPVVAEGISMAMQSAELLSKRLLDAGSRMGDPRAMNAVGRLYQGDWRRAFVPRIRAAMVIAQWAMRPALVAASIPILRCWPRLLTWGARLSGKARIVCPDPIPWS